MYKPACGNLEPHDFHHVEWIDMHFKEHHVWCGGVCGCGMTSYYSNPHGPGEHK